MTHPGEGSGGWRPAPPVYRRAWQQLRDSRRRKRLGWVLLASLAGVIGLVGVPMGLLPPTYLLPAFPWSPLAAAIQNGLFIWQELIKQIVVLSAAPLAALVAGWLPAESPGDALSLTPYSGRQIQTARLAAVLRFLLIPLLLVALVRLTLLVSIAPITPWENPLFIPTALWRGFSHPLTWLGGWIDRGLTRLSLWQYTWWETWLRQFSTIRFLKAHGLWAAGYVLSPLFDAALFATAGLAAWTRIRRTEQAQVAVLGLALGLWAAGYLGERALAMGLCLQYNAGTTIEWGIGIPAMGSGYLGVPGLFAAALVVTTAVKLGLLGGLLAATRMQRTG